MIFPRPFQPTWARTAGLDDLPRHELRALERLGTVIRLPERHVVCRQHTSGRECVLVLDGELGVARDGRDVARVRSGYFAGEMALLTGQARNATVRATDGADVLVFNRREFSTVLDRCPTVTKRIFTTALARIG